MATTSSLVDLFKRERPKDRVEPSRELPKLISTVPTTVQDNLSPLLERIARGAASRPERSFEQFFNRNKPASELLENFSRSFIALETGQKFQTVRQEMQDRFQEQQRLDLIEQRNNTATLNSVATALNAQARLQLQEKVAESTREQKERQFAVTANQRVLDWTLRKQDLDRKMARDGVLNAKDQAAVRKIEVEIENFGKANPKDPFSFVIRSFQNNEDRLPTAAELQEIGVPLQRAFSDARRKPDPQPIPELLQAAGRQYATEGNLLNLQRVAGKEGMQEVFTGLARQGAIIRNPKFNTQAADSAAGVGIFNDIVGEIREIKNGNQDPEDSGLHQRLAGQLNRARAMIGEQALVSAVEAVSGPVARRMAKASGEVRISDQDAKAFIESIGQVDDTFEELAAKMRLNTRVFLQPIVEQAKALPRLGDTREGLKGVTLSIEDLPEAARQEQVPLAEFVTDFILEGGEFR